MSAEPQFCVLPAGRKYTYRRFHRIRACIGYRPRSYNHFYDKSADVLEDPPNSSSFSLHRQSGFTVGIRNRQGSQRIHDIVLAHNSQLHRGRTSPCTILRI